MTQETGRVLVGTPPPPPAPVSSAIVDVAKEHGISPIKQFREIISLYLGAPKLGANEYYAAGLFRSDLTKEQKKQFVGEKRNLALNQRLSPGNIARNSDFLDNKVLYTALLGSLGFPTTTVQAVVSITHGFGKLKTLQSIETVEEFLLNEAVYPVFGKPIEGSKSVGSALFSSVDRKARTIVLGNGIETAVTDLAKEIFTEFSYGYVFQSVIEQHDALNAVIGSAVGTIRVVTLMQDGAPEVLYTVWKIPAPEAMSDNFWQKGSMIAELDANTGQIKQVRRGVGMNVEQIENHPVSGAALVGFAVPYWDEIIALARRCHTVTPENGVLGWDIAVGPDGPLVIECNTSPAHSLYQMATGRGVLNEEFLEKFTKVFNRNKKISKAIKAADKSE